MTRSLLEEAAKVLRSELTAGQKKLPPALQKAIKDKEDKKDEEMDPKKDMVNNIAEMRLEIEKNRFLGAEDESLDSVHELMLISQCLRESMKDMKMNVLNDLQKFYPEAWSVYERFKRETMMCSLVRTIKKGQEEGYFRVSLDAELMAIIRMEQVQAFILNQNIYPKDKYTLAEVQMQVFDHFMHGLFTIEGHQLFNQYTKEKLKQNETFN